jgi:hypothetical protein
MSAAVLKKYKMAIFKPKLFEFSAYSKSYITSNNTGLICAKKPEPTISSLGPLKGTVDGNEK